MNQPSTWHACAHRADFVSAAEHELNCPAHGIEAPPAGPVTVARMLAALAELGTTPDAVADRLRALGIKGGRGQLCRCPIAVYIQTRLGVRAAVSHDLIQWGAWPAWLSTSPPLAVAVFIRRHDSGVYLDLVDTGAEVSGA